MANLAVLRVAVLSLSAKSLRRADNRPPPPGRARDKALYLRNRMSDRQAVFPDENTTWMSKLYGMVTILCQCRSWQVARAKLGYTAKHSTDNSCPWIIFGVLQHVRTCSPHFHVSRTAEPIALIFGM